jgi:hypothetical protein
MSKDQFESGVADLVCGLRSSWLAGVCSDRTAYLTLLGASAALREAAEEFETIIDDRVGTNGR